jgi:hypothetical protein
MKNVHFWYVVVEGAKKWLWAEVAVKAWRDLATLFIFNEVIGPDFK